MPRGDDVRAKTVYDSPGIVVTGASAEYLLAMKVFAAREPDLQDIKHLAGMLGIDEASDAIRGRTPGRAGKGQPPLPVVAASPLAWGPRISPPS